MTARTAADVPELVEAAAQAMSTLPLANMDPDLRDAIRRGARAALSVVPAPLRPIDPDDDQQRHAVEAGDPCGDFPMDSRESLTALRDLGVGLPARAEPSDAAVETAVLWRAMMDTADAACVRCDAPQLTDLLDALARVW